MKRLGIFGCVLTLFCTASAGYCAQTGGIDFEGCRADGMGGAYTAVAEGYEGVFYNPSGLTKLSTGHLILPSIYFKANQGALNYILYKDDVNKLAEIGPLYGSFKGVGIAGIISPTWALNFYTVGNGISVHTSTYQRWILQYDMGGVLSVAGKLPKFLPIIDISLGTNLKYIYRNTNMYGVVQPASTPSHGYGLDIGAMCNLLGFIDAGVMFKDVFTRVGSDTVAMSVNIGVSTKLLYFLTLSMDFTDLALQGGDFLDKVKLGAEANLFELLKVRGGLSQRHPTVGLGVSLLFLNVDYAFMGEKVIENQTLNITGSNLPVGNHSLCCAIVF